MLKICCLLYTILMCLLCYYSLFGNLLRFLFLYSKEKEEEESSPACKWYSNLFIMVLLQFFYSFGIDFFYY